MINKIIQFFKSVKKISWIIIGLFLADFLSKIFAYLFLGQPDDYSIESAPIIFHLVLNQSGLGYGQMQIIQSAGISNIETLILFSSIFYIWIATAIIFYNKIPVKRWIKITAIITLSTLLFILFSIAVEKLPIQMPHRLLLFLRGLGPLILALVFFNRSKSLYFKTLWGLISAGNAGNYLSFFYPPFAVVDFIGLRFLHPVNTVYYNLADFYLMLFLPMLVFSPIFLLIRKIYLDKKKQPQVT